MPKLPLTHVVAAAAVALFAAAGLPLRAQTTAPVEKSQKPGFSRLVGTITNSVHNGPLSKALVIIEGASLSGSSDAEGRFTVDSIPPGLHRILILHPVLDTLGLRMRTPAYPFEAGTSHGIDLAVPTGEQIAGEVCTRIQRTRGPAIMVGFVRDPETKVPATGAKVSLVYQSTDSAGHKRSTVREALVDSSGYYHICGLPSDMDGKVQVFRNGVSSGEVPIAVENNIAMRAFSIASEHGVVAEVTNDSGKVTKVFKGSARVSGRVVDKSGRPIEGARVTLQGGGKTVLTRQNGDFALDSLPSGTQALAIRKLGYTPLETAIELSSAEPATTVVRMDDFVPTLEVMRVEAAQDKALADVGFISRKRSGMGFYMDGATINREAMSFSDVMRVAPGLRFTPVGNGRSYMITDSRSSGGCVNYYVDGTQWQTMTPGDIDDFIRPSELVAIEVYRGGNQTPPQFTPPGQSGCTTIVAWTVAKVRPKSDASGAPSRRP